MKPRFNLIVIILNFFLMLYCFPYGSHAAKPEIPKIDNIVMLQPQPHESDEHVIWYDDFDGEVQEYGESSGGLSDQESFGSDGQSMLSHYEKGSRGEGNRKVFFGDSPTGRPIIHRGRKYEDVYWRIYIKHQHGWQGGGPDKMSRATSLAAPNWAQAMIAHIWSSGESLTLDPASGVVGDRMVTTRYNDFDNLRWLGNKPVSSFKIHSTEESGRWVCVEGRAKLNSPGQKDGVQELWIDGRLESKRNGLDWRGTYTEYGINAVFLESYWNNGSPVTQSRWIDNFVISAESIGPVVCPRNPTLVKTPFYGEGELKGWEVEVSADGVGNNIVWRSKTISDPKEVRIDNTTGQFIDILAGKNELDADRIYFVRVRQQDGQDEWSDWSGWHQPFRTERGGSGVEEWGSGY